MPSSIEQALYKMHWLLFILHSVDGRAYIDCCDCESTNLSFGLSSLTTGDVRSFQSSIMILSFVNH